MKQFARLYTSFILLSFISFTNVQAQKLPKIKGNRIVAPYNAPLEAFNAIVLDNDLKLNIVASDTTGVSIIADDNLPPVFKFKVTDRVLYISTYYQITASKQLDITLYTPTLDRVVVSSGELGLTLDPRFKKTQLSLSGNATVAVAGTVPSFSVSSDEKSFVNINGSFSSFAMQMTDRSTATIFGDVSNTAQLNIQDKASLKWGGTVAFLTASFDGASVLDAMDLSIDEASVHASGKSKLDLHILSHLTYFSKEESQLDLYGTPRIDLLEFSGTSMMRKKLLK
ncbi:DUF2807 domain-containing protein [Flavobacteriaceae bacterium]|nr:DUF2807 domain-containing protein [Flavobacteriaceae bacterium]